MYEVDFVFQICSSEDFRVSLLVVEDLYGSLPVNTDASFSIDFMCVYKDDFFGSLPTFIC